MNLIILHCMYDFLFLYQTLQSLKRFRNGGEKYLKLIDDKFSDIRKRVSAPTRHKMLMLMETLY